MRQDRAHGPDDGTPAAVTMSHLQLSIAEPQQFPGLGCRCCAAIAVYCRCPLPVKPICGYTIMLDAAAVEAAAVATGAVMLRSPVPAGAGGSVGRTPLREGCRLGGLPISPPLVNILQVLHAAATLSR